LSILTRYLSQIARKDQSGAPAAPWLRVAGSQGRIRPMKSGAADALGFDFIAATDTSLTALPGMAGQMMRLAIGLRTRTGP